jgi:hypothetical protein
MAYARSFWWTGRKVSNDLRRAFRSPLADHFSSEISFNSLSASEERQPKCITVARASTHANIRQS